MALRKRCLIIAIPILITVVYVAIIGQYESNININIVETEYDAVDDSFAQKHFAKFSDNWRHLSEKEINSLSKLGKILYMDDIPPKIGELQEKYKILLWKYGPTIERRHIYHFDKIKHNPFEDCSVTNCILTYDDEDLNTADLVLIHLHRTAGITDLPPRENRSETQIWAFLTDESPYHTFMNSKNKLNDFNGIFNWSMTYRMDSDIPVPYGRSVINNASNNFYPVKEFNRWKRAKSKDILVAIMGSNCGSRNHRWEYVKELKKYINVDIYGRCGTLKCPGHFDSDCPKLDDYLFYLAFENSNCDDYMTEKLWWNAYHKNAIPIIMGPAKDNLAKLLPYHSYISVEDFASPRDLGNFLVYLNNTPSELMTYFAWKSRYTILNEHGYFKSNSYHYCRACEALNYNSKENKVYTNLEQFWSTKNCYPAWDT